MATGLPARWGILDGRKGDLKERCEQYARWTLPWVCPIDNTKNQEHEKGSVDIGSRLVNHLSHRIVDTMFPNDRPFFSLSTPPQVERELTQDMDEQELSDWRSEVNVAVANAENDAMRMMDLTSYRPIAVQAVSHQIITGNIAMLRAPDGKRINYGIKDFCARRNVKGDLVEAMLKDNKYFGSLPEFVKEQVRTTRPDLKDEDECILYTRFSFEGGKWMQTQSIDEVSLDNETSYNVKDMPLMILTWNLTRGEHYGRGLVEDYAVTFHNLDVTTKAMLDLIGISADIKWLVDPSSILDIAEWNAAPRGAYMPGRKDDISTPDFPKQVEISQLAERIQTWEQGLARAFLLSSAGVRDAERVTAEEIRFMAREIESAFGGLYSRLAIEWQKREADWLISQINFSEYYQGEKIWEVRVTTGLESLSREGQLDMLRLAVSDLQMLNEMPEPVLATIDIGKFATHIFMARGVKAIDFIKTAKQMQDEQQAAQAQEQQLIAQQQEGNVAAEAAKAALKE